MCTRRNLSMPAKVLMYLIVVLLLSLFPSYHSHYVPTAQKAFQHWGGWTWLGVGSLVWFLIPPLFFVALCRERRWPLTWGKRLLFSIGWSMFCTVAGPGQVEETLLYAVLMYGYQVVLLSLGPVRWRKEATR